LIAGTAPGALWDTWLAGAGRALQPDTSAQPILPAAFGGALSAIAAASLVAVPLLAGRGRPRPAASDPEMRAEGIMPPAALGQSLTRVAWASRPPSLAGLWDIGVRASGLVSNLLSLFERRYYLAGLLLAMIVVILIFI
jgi:hypothetical protein